MNEHDQAKADLLAAQKIASEVCGENPPADVVAAVLNSLTAQRLAVQFSDAAANVSNALFQTSR